MASPMPAIQALSQELHDLYRDRPKSLGDKARVIEARLHLLWAEERARRRALKEAGRRYEV